ncbi:MAG: hemolysin family protein [Acidimicrobiales bacterium]
MTGWYLFAAGVLLLANAFFVAVEFALVTSRHERLESLAAEGRRSAQVALGSSRELSLQLAGAQLGITMASLGLGYVGEPSIGHLVESALGPIDLPETVTRGVAFAVALLIVSFLHLVIGEMVPKNIAIAGPERTLLLLAIPNRVYVTMFRPVIRGLNAAANAGVRLFGIEPKDELASAHSAEELSAMLAASREEGLIEGFEHDLLSGALGFADRPVAEVMVPRDEIVAVSMRSTVVEVERLVNERGHSRLPVLGRDLDDVLGFIHVKDLLQVPADGQGRPLPMRQLRRMLVVEDDWSLEDVLLRMQRARLHLALVIDRDRRTVGMVALEDVLESLVGDIFDESDATGR